MKTTHEISINNVKRVLPIRLMKSGARVALLNILGDWELAEVAGKELAKRIPEGTEVLFMPDGKAQNLLHVMGRESGLTTVIARKERMDYMAEPVIHVTRDGSMTTDKKKELYLGNDEVEMLRGKRVVFVDDVVSTGGTLKSVKELLTLAGAELVGIMAVYTEGGERSDVVALGNLPLF